MAEQLNQTVTAPKDATKEAVDKSLHFNSDQEEAIKSALSAGYGITPDTQPDGGALKVESLDPEIKNQTWGTNDFTIYPQLVGLGVVKANSTVEKYVTFLKHGRIGHSVFQPEIGIGSVNSPHMKQKTVNLKFLVDVKQQSFAIQYAATVEDAARINEEDALVVLGKTIEWATFYGDADLTSGEKGEGLEFDGLEKLIDDRNKIDLRDGILTPEVLNEAAVLIGKGFGVATDAYMPIGVKADFGNQFLGAQRVIVPSQDGTTAGVNIDRFLSARGEIRLNGSTIMDLDNILDDEYQPNPQAPTAPTLKAQEQTKAGGQFLEDEKDAKGKSKYPARPVEVGATLHYKVVAVGHHGDSFPSDDVTAIPSAKDSAIKLTATLSSMQREIPDYVAFYRKAIENDDYYLVGRVATRDMNQGDGTITFTDTDARIPNTADVFVGEMRHNVISLLEFIPMSKINLAVVTTATSFAVLTSVAIALYLPRRFSMIRNVRYNNGTENHMTGLNVYSSNQLSD